MSQLAFPEDRDSNALLEQAFQQSPELRQYYGVLRLLVIAAYQKGFDNGRKGPTTPPVRQMFQPSEPEIGVEPGA